MWAGDTASQPGSFWQWPKAQEWWGCPGKPVRQEEAGWRRGREAAGQGPAAGGQWQGRAVPGPASGLCALAGRGRASEITRVVTSSLSTGSAKRPTCAAQEPVRAKVTPSVGGRELIFKTFLL